MLISEFARVVGLSTDTVRFYVRLGFLVPEANGMGGRNPYAVFTDAHVKTVQEIRLGQSLGLTLNQMLDLKREQGTAEFTSERRRELASSALADLERKAEDIQAMIEWLRATVEWTDNGEVGASPVFPWPREGRTKRASR